MFTVDNSPLIEQGSLIVIREPYRDGQRESTWTGPGFVRTTDDSFIEFDITDLLTTMEYDLVIRYEPQVCLFLLLSYLISILIWPLPISATWMATN